MDDDFEDMSQVNSCFLDSSNAVPGAVQEGLVGSGGASSDVSVEKFQSGIIDSCDNVPGAVQEGLVNSGDGSSELNVEFASSRDAVPGGLRSVESLNCWIGRRFGFSPR